MKGIKMNGIGEDFFEIVHNNLNVAYSDFILSGTASKLSAEKRNLIAVQIRARKSLSGKIDGILQNKRFLIPDLLIAEQASNEAVASYNASLAHGMNSLIDLTAGLGIDVIHFARIVKKVTAVEVDGWRAEVLNHNLAVLGINNVQVVNSDASTFLESPENISDIIYLDPSRRAENGRRIFIVTECKPDVVQLLPVLKERCKRLLIKASPLLDLKDTIRRLPDIRTIHIVEYKREIKEILIEIDFGKTDIGNPEIRCVNVSDVNHFDILDVEFSNVDRPHYLISEKELDDFKYLYEPSASLFKSGVPDVVCNLAEDMHKLDANTHFYASNTFIPNFFGRCFIIEKVIGRKEMKNLQNNHFNVISRNHPLKADEILKKYKIIPGGENFLIACRVSGKPTLILARYGG